MNTLRYVIMIADARFIIGVGLAIAFAPAVANNYAHG
jgi:hypothetical protein